ncbi:MAG: sulfatase [Armatimonadota bacterium]
MNIIVVVSDSLRKDHLGVYGSEWCRTPRLDRFAEDAIVFEQAFQSSHPTIPMRTDAFTGRFSFPWHGWQPLDRDVPVMSEMLGDAGYLTMLVADTYHMFKQGFYFDRGFSGWWWNRGQEGDRFITDPTIPIEFPCDPDLIRQPYPDRYPNIIRNRAHRQVETDWFAPGTVTHAMQWLERNHSGAPFMLWVDLFDPHEPWDPPEHYIDMYDPDFDLPNDCDYPVNALQDFLSERELHRTRARYCAEVTMVDRWFGNLVDKVDDLGLREDTLVLFMSDHGQYFDYPGDGGLIGKPQTANGRQFPMYQSLINVPCIIRPPGGASGERTDAIVQAPDLLPTFLDLTGAETDAPMHGTSFADILGDAGVSHREFAVSARHNGVIQLTDGRHSFACWPNDIHEPVLFDLHSDPNQETNAAADAPEVVDTFRDRLLEFLRGGDAPEAFVENYA